MKTEVIYLDKEKGTNLTIYVLDASEVITIDNKLNNML